MRHSLRSIIDPSNWIGSDNARDSSADKHKLIRLDQSNSSDDSKALLLKWHLFFVVLIKYNITINPLDL